MGDPSNASEPLVSRICEADVPRFGVKVDDPVSSQLTQQLANHGPSFAEKVFRLGFPIREHLRREIGGTVEIGLGEVEHTRRKDDRHLDREQIVIVIQKLGDREACDAQNALLPETKICRQFTLVTRFPLLDLEGRPSRRLPHRAVVAESQRPVQLEPAQACESLGSLAKLLSGIMRRHDHAVFLFVEPPRLVGGGPAASGTGPSRPRPLCPAPIARRPAVRRRTGHRNRRRLPASRRLSDAGHFENVDGGRSVSHLNRGRSLPRDFAGAVVLAARVYQWGRDVSAAERQSRLTVDF